ncbi:hypothetical protein [Micromonospora sp. CPCC 206061]|uniref:hypothetical protein n=1 Tax=Micromonospora sp. CPCC 206061 TaxID=3122410 RepID=UPI002FF0D207
MIGKAIGRWALIAIAVPLVAAGARQIGNAVEQRRGSSRATRILHRGADTLQRLSGRKRRRRFSFR